MGYAFRFLYLGIAVLLFVTGFETELGEDSPAADILSKFERYKAVSFEFTVSENRDGDLIDLYNGNVVASTETDPIPTYPAMNLKLTARSLDNKSDNFDYQFNKLGDHLEMLHTGEKVVYHTMRHRFGTRLYLAARKSNLLIFNVLMLLRNAEPDDIKEGHDFTLGSLKLKEIILLLPQQETEISIGFDPVSNEVRRLVVPGQVGQKTIYSVSNYKWENEALTNEHFMLNIPSDYEEKEFTIANVPVPGSRLKDWDFETYTGKRKSLSDFRNNVLLLDFWATWCVNCRFTFPEIAKLRKDFKGKQVSVLGLTYAENGDPVSYMNEEGYDWEIGIGQHIGEELGLDQTGLPIMMIVDKKGYVADFVVGYNRWQEGYQYDLIKETIENNL